MIGSTNTDKVPCKCCYSIDAAGNDIAYDYPSMPWPDAQQQDGTTPVTEDPTYDYPSTSLPNAQQEGAMQMTENPAYASYHW